jgi:DNA polymerase III subunit epsilon
MFGLFGRKGTKPSKITAQAPIADIRFVVLDTELTGLNEQKDSIVSIGALRMTGGRIDLGDTFYRLVSPEKQLQADTICIHEITPSDVAAEPKIDSVLADFLDFCGDDVLAGHFITIDLAFLNREMKRIYGAPLKNAAVDTFSIYGWLEQWCGSLPFFANPLTGCRLYDIVKRFDIPVSGAHNAIMDAFTTAQLLQRFIPLLARAGVLDQEELFKIGAPFEGGDRFGLTRDFGNF